jgi:beta-fructofuranosidase
MRDLRTLLVLLALSLGYARSAPAAAQVSLPDLAAAANNSLFEKWRPRFHFLGPNSWQNDPCTSPAASSCRHTSLTRAAGAPYYDAATETYHMFYQVSPFSLFRDLGKALTPARSTTRSTCSGATFPGATRPAPTS